MKNDTRADTARSVNQYRRSFLKSVGSVSALSLFTGIGAASSHTTGNSIEIDSCTTITEPGTYTLTSDILDTPGESINGGNVCIYIEASDVILDGAGHTIDGVPGEEPSAGVLLPPDIQQTNVTIQNLTVTGWEFGILYGNASNGAIQNVTAADNGGIGIAVESGSSNNIITDNTVSNNSEGLTLFDATNNTLSDNLAQDNDVAGIAVVESNQNELLDNTAETTAGTTPEESEAESAGILLADSNSTVLRENTANDNGNDGIHINNACNTEVIRNTANDNADNGIEVVNSIQTLLGGNTATGNGGEDILIEESPDTIQTE